MTTPALNPSTSEAMSPWISCHENIIFAEGNNEDVGGVSNNN